MALPIKWPKPGRQTQLGIRAEKPGQYPAGLVMHNGAPVIHLGTYVVHTGS